MTVKITKDRVPDILKAIKDLTSKEVLVGIPDSEADRFATDKQAKVARKARKAGEVSPVQASGGISNALIGFLMEFGSLSGVIPERPHLVPGIDDAKDKIAKRMQAGAKAVLDGRKTDVSATLTAVGITAENAVKQRVTDGPFTPLASATLAKRRARGRTGEKPLIDTGQYRRAITHVVRKKGDD